MGLSDARKKVNTETYQTLVARVLGLDPTWVTEPILEPSNADRSAAAAFTPIFARPCTRPTVVVVLPSPAGVGVMAETSTSLPRRGLPVNAFNEIFAL